MRFFENVFFSPGRRRLKVSASSLAMAKRASRENHRWGLSPSMAPTMSLTEMHVVDDAMFLLAHVS